MTADERPRDDRRARQTDSPWEETIGFARAVAAGDRVLVAGTMPLVDGVLQGEGDPYEQTQAAFANALGALEPFGLGADASSAPACTSPTPATWTTAGRAHRELFGAVRPAATMVVVSGFVDSRVLVEVELEAFRELSEKPATDMTLAVRVIPCLDVDSGRVVKGVNFQNLRDAGDPVEMAKLYDAEGADELTFLDITASSGDRETTYDVVRRTAEQVFIPLTVGGGVRTADDVDRLLRAGADKVGVNTAAIARPELIREIAERFGSQVLVLSVDAGAAPSAGTPSGFEVTTHGGRRGTGIDAVEWAHRAAELGAGEILLNSMDADGTKDGYDTEMIEAVRKHVTVPVDRLRRRRHGWTTSPPPSRPAPTRCWPPPSSTSATCGSARSRTPCGAPGTRCAEGGGGARE